MSSHLFFRLSKANMFHFQMRCTQDARLAFAKTPEAIDPIYEIIIDGWGNTKSAIWKNDFKTVVVSTSNILNGGKFPEFSIRIQNSTIDMCRVYSDVVTPFMSHKEKELPLLLVATYSTRMNIQKCVSLTIKRDN
uniref:Farnesoic acid O-methyl transferase domain-containing protein n=1 Tax=Glossina palpalis gambiensis TaxID=67801 RepID=A0A1B0AZG3_9MUSC